MEWPSFLRFRSFRAACRGAGSYLIARPKQRHISNLRVAFRLRALLVLFSHRAASAKRHFPHIRLWADREVFPRIQTLLSLARHTIIIQMFIWKDDALGRAMAAVLLQAADRGVRVYIAKEAVGDFFETNGDFLSTRTDPDPLWARFWSHPSISITYAANHNHAKVYIIDGNVMLLTGMNIANEYDREWHDYLVEIHGTKYVDRYLSNGELPSQPGPVRIVMNTEQRAEIRPMLMELLRTAHRSIVIEHSYLSDAQVLSMLTQRSREGVSVTVVVPEHSDVHHYNNMRFVEKLLVGGSKKHVHIFLYPGIIHGKILLVDRSRAFLGSANLISSSIDEMGEVNVLIDSPFSGAVRKLRTILRWDVLHSRPLRSLPAMSWLWRFLAWSQL